MPYAVMLLLLVLPEVALAHGVTAGDQGYIQQITGAHLGPFAYLGVKHMSRGTITCCSCWGSSSSCTGSGMSACTSRSSLSVTPRR